MLLSFSPFPVRNPLHPLCIVRVDSLPHRKWKVNKQQPGTAGTGNTLGCCLVSLRFRFEIHSIHSVVQDNTHIMAEEEEKSVDEMMSEVRLLELQGKRMQKLVEQGGNSISNFMA